MARFNPNAIAHRNPNANKKSDVADPSENPVEESRDVLEDETGVVGSSNLPRFFDISDDSSDHLDELGLNAGSIVSFIANNINNPSIIFNARKGTGITDEMLADILGDEVSPENIQSYWEENGIIPSDPEAEDPEAEDPEAEDPEVEDPEAEDPEAEDPEVEDPEVEDPEVEDPEVEDPEVEDPEVEDPEVEDPEVDGNGNLPRFFDISDETSEHLDELGITPGGIVSFIANNIDNPSLIFNARNGTGITDEMLADILGDEVSPEDIQSYWEENGTLNSSSDVEMLGVNNLGAHDFIDIA